MRSGRSDPARSLQFEDRGEVVAALLDCGYAPFSPLGALLLSAYRCQVVHPVLWVERRAEHVEEGTSTARLRDGLSAGRAVGPILSGLMMRGGTLTDLSQITAACPVFIASRASWDPPLDSGATPSKARVASAGTVIESHGAEAHSARQSRGRRC